MARGPPRRISCHASDTHDYLDPGVGDAERQMAWRGVALVGSVKSDRLVEVTAVGGAIRRRRWRRPARPSGERSRRALRRGARDRRRS